MTEKRFTIIYNEQSKMMQYVDNYKEEPNKWAIWNARETAQELNELNKENEQLKQSVSNLKDTIIKITIAYQRKYDRTIVDLVDEVHDEDITDLIKELQE